MSIIKYYDNGQIYSEYYFVNGVLHRLDDEPAIIMYYNTGEIMCVEYFVDGLHYRPNDLPSSIYYYKNGNIWYENYYINGVLNRVDNKPSICVYYEDGSIQTKVYMKDGMFHRENKPAIIEYYPFGNKALEVYVINNIIHQEENKPAIIMYDDECNIDVLVYCVLGTLNNTCEAACVEYNENTKYKTYLHGKLKLVQNYEFGNIPAISYNLDSNKEQFIIKYIDDNEIDKIVINKYYGHIKKSSSPIFAS